ncbi:MAG: FAD-binding protein [Ferruginibacter sp.]
MPKPIQNFGRLMAFIPKQIATPATVAELAASDNRRSKAEGNGFKTLWSQDIMSDETIVSLEKLNQIIDIDFENKKVKTRAGIILKDLIAALEQKGLAMANLGSIHAQTLAGAICTGTHGTGKNFQCLAAQVYSFEMLDGLGQNHVFEKHNPEFYALLTGMGSCGIIHTITLDVVNCFQMHAITDTAGFDEVIANIDQYASSYDHFKCWWLAPSQKLILFKNNRTNAKRNDNNFKRFVQDDLISVWMYRLLVWVGKFNRKKFIPAIRRLQRQVENTMSAFVKCS